MREDVPITMDTVTSILEHLTACARDIPTKPSASDLVDAVAEAKPSVREGWFRDMGVGAAGGSCPFGLILRLADAPWLQGGLPGDLRMMRFDTGGGEVRAVVSDAFGGNIHGRGICWNGKTFLMGDRERMECEALLCAVQAAVWKGVCGSESREFRRIWFFMSGMSDSPAAPSGEAFAGPSGLREGRYRTLADAVVAKCRADGLRRDVVPDLRPHSDLRRATEPTGILTSRIRPGLFLRVEADAAMGHADAERFAGSLNRLLSEELLAMPPEDFGLVLRIRRYSGTSYRAHYAPTLREIVIPCDDPGLFAHEYAHAMDHFMGYPSSGRGFDGVLSMYRDMVGGRVPAERLEYLCSRTEVFARTFERFLTIRGGISPVCRPIVDSVVHPSSPEMDALVDGYFSGLLGIDWMLKGGEIGQPS